MNLTPSLSDLKRVRIGRDNARDGLLAFTEYTMPTYMRAPHHIEIADALDRVERGVCKRLMIQEPPRMGKSELASRRFPPFFIGRNPTRQIIQASYSADLAIEFGRDVKTIMGGTVYKKIFPGVQLRADSKAAGRWNTQQGGSYLAAGVGGGVTGRGADVLIIDDPIKDREEANSELQREKVWRWYGSVAGTRLQPGGSIVLIMTRWHQDDLAGRLIQEMKAGADQWEIIKLPALDKQGESIWPEWFSTQELLAKKRAMTAWDWASLYEQEPIPEGGEFFASEWFRWYEEVPRGLRMYGASDYAVSDQSGDYTVHLVVGVDELGNIYIVDLWRDRTPPDVWITVFCEMVKRYRPVKWLEEKGQIIKSVGPFLEQEIRNRKAFCYREQVGSNKDKPTRAQAIRGMFSLGKVYLRAGASWVDDLVSELLAFPSGTHDDQVDALSLIGRMLVDIKPMDTSNMPETYDTETYL